MGSPSPGYKGKGLFWTLDLVPDSVNEAASKMGKDKIKNKGDDRGKFVSFKQEYKQLIGKDGQPYMTTPPKVVKADGKTPWGDAKIGNGSKLDVKFKVVDYGDDKVGVYPIAIRVLKHVSFEGSEFDDLGQDDEFYQEVEAAGNAVEAEPEVEVKKTVSRKKAVVEDFDDEGIPF